MKLTVSSTTKTSSSIVVSDEVFGVAANKNLIAQAVRVYLSNQRQGTAKVKTRADINRTKKKWYKQKGTGGARHGARTPGIFVGGGVTHGPTGEQNWKLSLTKRMKQKALVCALSAQAAQILVVDDLLQLDGKTASAAKMLAKVAPDKKRVLVVLERLEPMVLRSLHNLGNVISTTTDKLTTYEVAACDVILITSGAVEGLTKRLTTKKTDSSVARSEAKVAAKTATDAKKAVASAPSESAKKVATKPAKSVAAKSAKPTKVEAKTAKPAVAKAKPAKPASKSAATKPAKAAKKATK